MQTLDKRGLRITMASAPHLTSVASVASFTDFPGCPGSPELHGLYKLHTPGMGWDITDGRWISTACFASFSLLAYTCTAASPTSHGLPGLTTSFFFLSRCSPTLRWVYELCFFLRNGTFVTLLVNAIVSFFYDHRFGIGFFFFEADGMKAKLPAA